MCKCKVCGFRSKKKNHFFFKHGPKLKGPTRQISPWLVQVNASLQILKFLIALFTFQMKYKILCIVKWVSDFPVPLPKSPLPGIIETPLGAVKPVIFFYSVALQAQI
jgi:hypothetical protein